MVLTLAIKRHQQICQFLAFCFFQPAYFCVKGHFYQLTPGMWLLRTGILALLLAVCNFYFFRYAKREHQAYGG